MIFINEIYFVNTIVVIKLIKYNIVFILNIIMLYLIDKNVIKF